MACPVCGLNGGAHTRPCIEQLIAVNNSVMAKCINRMYYHLDQLASRHSLDIPAIKEAMNRVRADLEELKVLNEAPRKTENIISAT